MRRWGMGDWELGGDAPHPHAPEDPEEEEEGVY
jgi:hypothetical protein